MFLLFSFSFSFPNSFTNGVLDLPNPPNLLTKTQLQQRIPDDRWHQQYTQGDGGNTLCSDIVYMSSTWRHRRQLRRAQPVPKRVPRQRAVPHQSGPVLSSPPALLPPSKQAFSANMRAAAMRQHTPPPSAIIDTTATTMSAITRAAAMRQHHLHTTYKPT